MIARASLLAFAERMAAQISVPYALAVDRTAVISVSIGIALAPEHGTNLAGLLSVADTALYEAKEGGRARCILATV